MSNTATNNRETMGFQAEVKQLLQFDDPFPVFEPRDFPARADF